MTYPFDLSPRLAWWVARDAYRTGTAALLRGALPALRLLGEDRNPYESLGCTLPALPDTDEGQVRIDVNNDVTTTVIEGLPVMVMRKVLVTRAGIFFSPFTAETSLGRTASEGRFTVRAHGSTQCLTVRAGGVADATLKLPVLTAAGGLREVRCYLRQVP